MRLNLANYNKKDKNIVVPYITAIFIPITIFGCFLVISYVVAAGQEGRNWIVAKIPDWYRGEKWGETTKKIK